MSCRSIGTCIGAGVILRAFPQRRAYESARGFSRFYAAGCGARRGVRLENRRPFTGTVGLNPTLSAIVLPTCIHPGLALMISSFEALDLFRRCCAPLRTAAMRRPPRSGSRPFRPRCRVGRPSAARRPAPARPPRSGWRCAAASRSWSRRPGGCWTWSITTRWGSRTVRRR